MADEAENGRDEGGRDLEVLIPQQRTFTIGDKEVTIRALKLTPMMRVQRRWFELVLKVKLERPDIDLSNWRENLAEVFLLYTDVIVNLLAETLGVDSKFLADNLEIAPALEILGAVLEANNPELILGNWQKFTDGLNRAVESVNAKATAAAGAPSST